MCFFSDVKEWLHQNHKRCVKVKIGPEETISTVNRKGEVLRRIDFKGVNSLVIEVTRDTHRKPMVLIRSPRDHDLVRMDAVKFNHASLSEDHLRGALKSFKKVLTNLQTYVM